MTQEGGSPREGIKERIEKANQQALQRIYDSQPVWVGMARALDVIPGMTKHTVLHSGPPTSYEWMCIPQQVAVRGSLIYEGMARDTKEADELARSGDLIFEPCHHHRTVGPMAGIITASTSVIVVRNETFDNEAYCVNNENLGRQRLRAGYFDEGVLANMRWHEEVVVPALDYALRKLGGINLKRIISRALTMGDECHSRNRAGTSLLAMELMPVWLDGGLDRAKAEATVRFIALGDQFFGPPVLAACKATADAADCIEYSTIVTAIARNGVETGIRVSGLPGQWFTGPAGTIEGFYHAGFSVKDSNPDLGDSAITETMGLGAFAMAAAPALEFAGTLEKALNTSREMDEITVGNNPHFPIPTLNGLGAPTGIDIRLVLDKGIAPAIDTGIVHKDGLGDIGQGNTRAPMEAFQKALKAFRQRYLQLGGSRW